MKEIISPATFHTFFLNDISVTSTFQSSTIYEKPQTDVNIRAKDDKICNNQIVLLDKFISYQVPRLNLQQ